MSGSMPTSTMNRPPLAGAPPPNFSSPASSMHSSIPPTLSGAMNNAPTTAAMRPPMGNNVSMQCFTVFTKTLCSF